MSFLSKLFGVDKAKSAIKKASKKSQASLQSGYDDVAGMYDPYVQGGQQAYGTLQNLVGMGGPGMQGVANDAWRQTPGYQAGMDAGIGAIDRSAVGRAGGNVLRDLYKYGSDYEDQRFGQHYNRMAGIADQGFNATGAVAGARTGMAQGQAGIQQNTGNQMANASLAGGSMLMGGLNSLAGLAGYGMGGGFGGGGFGVPTSAQQKLQPMQFSNNGNYYNW
jgi:hypothetical protein